MLPSLWQACLTAFLDECRSVQTRRAYAGILNAFIKHLDRTAIQDASKQDVLSFLHKLGRAHTGNPTGEPSPALWNARLSTLSSFYRFASGYTVPGASGPEALFQRTSPTSGLKLRAAPTMPKGLTPDEVKRFFAAIDQETLRILVPRSLLSNSAGYELLSTSRAGLASEKGKRRPACPIRKKYFFSCYACA